MARTIKKESALTPEEKLAQALVPEEEQPYQVPDNWCWSKIGAVCSFERGITFPAAAKEAIPTDRNIPCLRTANIQDELIIDDLIYVDKSYMKGNDSKLTRKDDIIMSSANSRELVGKTSYVSYVPYPMTFGGFVLTIRSKNILSKYMYYYLRFEFLMGKFMGESTQTTNIANINTSKLSDYSVPFPPLAEQQRIVDRIESLFAKLDEAKEKAQAVVDGFEDRKAAILHKAFTGELTAEWREENGVSMHSWISATVKDVCQDVKVGIVIKPSQYYTNAEEGTPAFRSANVREFHIDDFDWVYLDENGMNANKRSIVHSGDVLVVRSGNPGTACVVDEKYNGFNAIDILIAVPNKNIITSEFLCAFTNSPMGRRLVAESKRGMALAHFNVSGYSKLRLEVPSIPEQREITKTLFNLIEKEELAKDTAEQSVVRIDNLKRSILARAFRGELGTNDPADESAEELLKRML